MRIRAIFIHSGLRRVNLPALGLFITLTICFGSNAESSSDENTVSQHQITITGFEFIPRQLKAFPGDTITWINKDVVPHNIAVEDGQQVLSPDLANSEKFTLIVEKSLSYVCELHPTMEGEVVMVSPGSPKQAYLTKIADSKQ